MNTNKALITAVALVVSGFTLSAQDRPNPERPPGDAPRGERATNPTPQRPMATMFGQLDANHDGAIDSAEIDSLRKLDRNGDGKITPDEFRPAGQQEGDHRVEGERRNEAVPRAEGERRGPKPEGVRRDGDRPGTEGSRDMQRPHDERMGRDFRQDARSQGDERRREDPRRSEPRQAFRGDSRQGPMQGQFGEQRGEFRRPMPMGDPQQMGRPPFGREGRSPMPPQFNRPQGPGGDQRRGPEMNERKPMPPQGPQDDRRGGPQMRERKPMPPQFDKPMPPQGGQPQGSRGEHRGGPEMREQGHQPFPPQGPRGFGRDEQGERGPRPQPPQGPF